jgi:hypothetical protein
LEPSFAFDECFPGLKQSLPIKSFADQSLPISLCRSKDREVPKGEEFQSGQQAIPAPNR